MPRSGQRRRIARPRRRGRIWMARRALAEYRRKRNPSATPEPGAGGSARAGDGRSFVVQRHSATRLHYDFRLERDGVLASWAVPKGLPTGKGARRLAVHTEDHPLAYGGVGGGIPEGQDGGGGGGGLPPRPPTDQGGDADG